MKIMLQKLWELKLEWDEEVPDYIQQQHHLWRSQLTLLKEILISCYYYRMSSKVLWTKLHGFCDASENAYAAVVYLRTTYMEGPPTLTMVAAKTKVAPLKQLSNPRLELCGAQLLPKLLLNISNALQIGISHSFAWMIVRSFCIGLMGVLDVSKRSLEIVFHSSWITYLQTLGSTFLQVAILPIVRLRD